MSAASAEPQSLADAAYQRLRSCIVSCRLAPGQRLTERSLAEQTGFGISPVRDALTRLDHEGLVRTLPRKGYQVTPLTLKTVDDLFTMWRIVAPEIVRLGLRDATAAQIERLAVILGEISGLKERQEVVEDGARLAAEFFVLLAAATQNDYLITIQRRVQDDLARVRTLTVQASAHMPDLGVSPEWVRLAERRDGDALARGAAASLAEMHNRALQIFSRWPSIVANEITPLEMAPGSA